MSKSTSFLYQLARAANDIEKLASGDPKRIARRAKNKYIFDEWKKFVQGINKADEEFKRIEPD